MLNQLPDQRLPSPRVGDQSRPDRCFLADEPHQSGTVEAVSDQKQSPAPSVAPEPPIISFRNVRKTYGDRVALDDVSFDVQRGQLAFLVGPSGSGKTTILKLLTRELIAERGLVHVAGKDLGRLRVRKIPQLRRVTAVVPQEYPLLPGRSLDDNIRFALAVLGWPKTAAKQRTSDVLELVGLGNRSGARPDELSGGERQRAAIARAIAPHPKILLADEPTGNLDPKATAGIMRLLDQIAREGTTVLVSTHDRAVVDALRRQVIALDKGKIARLEANGQYAAATEVRS